MGDKGDQSETVTLIFPEPPSANRWWRKWRNRMVLSDEARAYKEQVWAEAKKRRVAKIAKPQPVRVFITWHRSRKAGDLDKRIGILLDAMQGTIYDSDAQVREIYAERRELIKTDKMGARVHVRVELSYAA